MTYHLSLMLLCALLCRVRSNFVGSGSLDCTIKLWSLKGVFKETRQRGIVRLKVKYTQLAHKKVRACSGLSCFKSASVCGGWGL
jgi:hypothetical protein